MVEEKYIRAKIGNAELIPDMHIQNPKAFCSYQAFQELTRASQELLELKDFKQAALEVIKSVAALSVPDFLESADTESLAGSCIHDTRICREFLIRMGE